MADTKPTIIITDKASKANVQEQIEKVVNYAESIERDIAGTTTDNEVVQARGGYSTLSQRLAVPQSQLPVFDYSIVGTGFRTTTFDCSLTWKGRHWRDTVTVTLDTTVAGYRILCFDLESEKFEEQYYVKTKLPLLTLKRYNIYNMVTLFDSDGNPQEIGAFPANATDIVDKSLFAWAPASGIKKDNTLVESIFFCTEKFIDCDIDFMGIPLIYQGGINFRNFICENTTIRNVRKPENISQGNDRSQFVIEGNNNVIHLLDNTKIDFRTSTGEDNEHDNTLFIPYDSEDNYYVTMADESADRISLLSTVSTTTELNGGQTEIGTYKFFDLFISGKRYKRPKCLWVLDSGRIARTSGITERAVVIEDYPMADVLCITVWVQNNSGSLLPRRISVKWGIGLLFQNDYQRITGSISEGRKQVAVRDTIDRGANPNEYFIVYITVRGIEV